LANVILGRQSAPSTAAIIGRFCRHRNQGTDSSDEYQSVKADQGCGTILGIGLVQTNKPPTPTVPYFRQFRDPATAAFTYLIGCCDAGEAAIVDPVVDHVPLYLAALKEMGLALTWILETHLHSDHISAADTLREWTGARIGAGHQSGIDRIDYRLHDDESLFVGDLEIEVLATPGHTPGCVSYRWTDRLLTGDSLLIGGCGSIDEPGGNGATLFDSVTRRLFSFADEMLVYPGHALNERCVSCIGEERQGNPLFHGISRDGFVAIKNRERRQSAFLPMAMEANRHCGRLMPASHGPTQSLRNWA
jgi:glyoxylase-like metal-dependent hydrolase (beta-lactamase superfamily II)